MAFRPTLLARDWLITTEHYLSAEAGAAVLRDGGNAMDAAVAAVLAECVVNPHMLSLGGEVVMLVHEAATGRVTAMNGHTVAPRGLTLDRCRAAGLTIGLPTDHPLAWSAPATPHALLTALERWGTRPLASVAAAAQDLARRGFPMHPGLRGPASTCPSPPISTASAAGRRPPRSTCPAATRRRSGRSSPTRRWPTRWISSSTPSDGPAAIGRPASPPHATPSTAASRLASSSASRGTTAASSTGRTSRRTRRGPSPRSAGTTPASPSGSARPGPTGPSSSRRSPSWTPPLSVPPATIRPTISTG